MKVFTSFIIVMSPGQIFAHACASQKSLKRMLPELTHAQPAHTFSLANFLFCTLGLLIFSTTVNCGIRPLFWETCQVGLGFSPTANEAVHRGD